MTSPPRENEFAAALFAHARRVAGAHRGRARSCSREEARRRRRADALTAARRTLGRLSRRTRRRRRRPSRRGPTLARRRRRVVAPRPQVDRSRLLEPRGTCSSSRCDRRSTARSRTSSSPPATRGRERGARALAAHARAWARGSRFRRPPPPAATPRLELVSRRTRAAAFTRDYVPNYYVRVLSARCARGSGSSDGGDGATTMSVGACRRRAPRATGPPAPPIRRPAAARYFDVVFTEALDDTARPSARLAVAAAARRRSPRSRRAVRPPHDALAIPRASRPPRRQPARERARRRHAAAAGTQRLRRERLGEGAPARARARRAHRALACGLRDVTRTSR